MAEAGPHDCETQKNEIGTLIKTSLKKGETWYLIDTKWFKQWKKYVGFDSWDTSYVGDQSAYPGPIDNSPLLKEGEEGDVLKEHLVDELDYMLVPDEGWKKLVAWYNLLEGQVPIARKVIEQGMFVKHCKVEVYLMDLKLTQNNDIENLVSKQFSRADTIDHIEKEMRKLFNIESKKEVRLWNKYMSNTYEHLNKLDNTVQDAGLYQGQVIVIEQKNEDGTWPRQGKNMSNTITNHNQTSASSGSSSQDINSTSPAKNSGSSFSGTYSSSGYGSTSYNNYSSANEGYRSTSSPGLCGLSNLGNTCFMNSALQCMMNVPHLTKYMLNDEWKAELNYDNPLGMHGEIATSYAELCKHIWSGKYSYTVPRNFKVSVGRFQPQFSGYQQQDSQELMAFLLDGLHEDLNRIKNKPYLEMKDADDRPDDEVAKEAWSNYLKRNDSLIVDIFHGLLKSTLVCPECQKISITFDPFCYLSLPLPIKKERQIEVFLIYLDPSKKPKQFKLTVPKMGIVSDMCKGLSKLTAISPDKMVVTDVYNHRFHKIFEPSEGLSHILDRDDIFIYETPVAGFGDADTALVPVYMREQRVKPSYNNYTHTSTQLFGQPLLIPVPRKSCTYESLYNSVINKTSRYVRLPDDNDEWWKKSPPEEEKEEGQMNGEMEVNEDSDTSEEKKSTTNGSSEDTEDENVNEADDKQQPRMFTFHSVNSYGSSEVDKIKDDGSPIKLSNRSYLAMDWHPKAKEVFYDEKAAEELDVDDSVNVKPLQKKQVIQLTECLDLFTTTEKLGEQDPWYCPRCKKHQQATKKFDLWQLPETLVIHLKRFSYNRYWRDKLDTFVEYPTQGLDMKKWIINSNHGPTTYDLMAVSNHYGGMGGGHYTAYAKNKDDDKWYYFDDSSVSPATEEAVVTKAGYVLVYQRRDTIDRSRPHSKAPAAAGAAGSPEKEMTISNGGNSSEDEMDTN